MELQLFVSSRMNGLPYTRFTFLVQPGIGITTAELNLLFHHSPLNDSLSQPSHLSKPVQDGRRRQNSVRFALVDSRKGMRLI